MVPAARDFLQAQLQLHLLEPLEVRSQSYFVCGDGGGVEGLWLFVSSRSCNVSHFVGKISTDWAFARRKDSSKDYLSPLNCRFSLVELEAVGDAKLQICYYFVNSTLQRTLVVVAFE